MAEKPTPAEKPKKKSRTEAFNELVAAKVAAGLPKEDAATVATAQVKEDYGDEE